MLPKTTTDTSKDHMLTTQQDISQKITATQQLINTRANTPFNTLLTLSKNYVKLAESDASPTVTNQLRKELEEEKKEHAITLKDLDFFENKSIYGIQIINNKELHIQKQLERITALREKCKDRNNTIFWQNSIMLVIVLLITVHHTGTENAINIIQTIADYLRYAVDSALGWLCFVVVYAALLFFFGSCYVVGWLYDTLQVICVLVWSYIMPY